MRGSAYTHFGWRRKSVRGIDADSLLSDLILTLGHTLHEGVCLQNSQSICI